MPRGNLLDIAKLNGSDQLVGLIDETVRRHPELNIVPSRTIKGQSYKTVVRTSLPAVSFRNANEGVTVDKSQYENRTVDCFYLTPRIEVDKVVADKYEDGSSAYLTLEGAGVMESTLQMLATQMYYGRTNDAKGFPGLLAAYDATNMVVDAGGTTTNTGSSAWLLCTGAQNVQWVWGSGGEMMLSDARTETLYDSNSKPFTGYVQDMTAYPGLQVGTPKGVARIKKLTADSGKGLTDSLIAQALALFPAGYTPDLILLNRRSSLQLQQARTTTIFSMAGVNPSKSSGILMPPPTDWNGIPIGLTDAITSTESLTL